MTTPEFNGASLAPSLDDFERLMIAAWHAIPAEMQNMCGHVELFVADFADAETLGALGIEDPFDLSGVYMGVDLTQKSVSDPSPEPDRIFLFRRPILDEWADRGNVSLAELVHHVLIHEIGHHFGLSDSDMHAIEESSG